MKNVCKEYIFPSLVYTVELDDVDNLRIVDDLLRIKSSGKAVLKSNQGGWQSPLIDEELKTSSLRSLEQKVVEAVDFVLSNEKVNAVNYVYEYWANINGKDAYNTMHHHARVLISAVYYPHVPEDCSADLVFTRTDAAAYFHLHANDAIFTVYGKTGKLVLFSPHLFHHVTTNNSEENRVSVAFNFIEVI